MSRFAAALGVLVLSVGVASASKKRNRNRNRQDRPPQQQSAKRDEGRGHDNHSLGKDQHFGKDRSRDRGGHHGPPTHSLLEDLGELFFGDWSGPSKPEKPKIPRKLRLPKKVIDSAHGFEAHRFPIRVAVLGRGDTTAVPSGLTGKLRDFAKLVAGKRYPLVTGGGHGLPREAERAAHEGGGETWAVAASRDVDDQIKDLYDVSATSVLYPTGTGGGAGTIEREAPLVQLANIRTYWNGGPGTFGELIAGLHEPGVIALAAGSGGVAGHAPEKILPFVGVPDHVRVVASSDPQRMMDRAETALADLQRRGLITGNAPSALYSPKSHESVVPFSTRDKRVVMSLLLDDGGRATAEDRVKTFRLIDHALKANMKGKRAFMVSGENELSRKVMIRASVDHNVGGVLVSTEGGKDSAIRAVDKEAGREAEETIAIRRTGKGSGVGEFASHREVVEHADVIFVNSAYYKNLAGLAFSLRQSKSSVIGVLELDSTRSRHLKELLKTVVGDDLSSRYIFDSDPARLVQKVKEKLEEKPKFKSFSSSGPSWPLGSFWGRGIKSSPSSDKGDKKGDEKKGDKEKDEDEYGGGWW